MKTTIKKLIYKLYNLLFPEIWVVSDRVDSAGDNGEAMFRYLRERKVNAVFLLNKDSPDFDRVRKTGRALSHGTPAFHLVCAVAAYNLSSQLDIRCENAIEVYLKHGIADKDLSRHYNHLYSLNPRTYMIAAARSEYDALCGDAYHIPAEQVWLTGLARYDLLEDRPEKKVFVCLTWRAFLFDNTGSQDEVRENLLKSEYCKRLRALLRDEQLKESLKAKGYTLSVKLHPNLRQFISAIGIPEDVEIYAGSYRDLFAEGNLLITDYSSVAFDFAYLGKPVIYYQFDYDRVMNGDHSYKQGYFDYERDGLGPVVTNADALRERIKQLIDSDCRMEEKYLKRTNDFFAFRDRGNRDRIYQNILALAKKAR